MTFREDFVAHFGQANADAIEAAADSHKNGINDKEGSDRFRWALLLCIGYECISRPAFAQEHKITCSWEDVRDWLKEHRKYIAAHDGDVDSLAMVSGVYNEFV